MKNKRSSLLKSVEHADKDKRSYFAFVSVFLLIITVVLVILWLVLAPSYTCTTDAQCLYGGTCNTATYRCECTQYPQYPYCDPSQSYLWSASAICGLFALVTAILLVISVMSFSASSDRHFVMDADVEQLKDRVTNLEAKLNINHEQ